MPQEQTNLGAAIKVAPFYLRLSDFSLKNYGTICDAYKGLGVFGVSKNNKDYHLS